MIRKNVRCTIGPASFRNPVMLASGPAGYGMEYAEFIDLSRLGGLVTKTITFGPRPGNPGRRLWEVDAGLLNSVGLENVGAEEFFASKLPALLEMSVKPVVSLAAEEWGEYEALIDVTASKSGFDAVEINLSCPNVEWGGMAIGTSPELVGKYIEYAKSTLGHTAVLAKLTPNVSDIESLAQAAEEAGADGITAINTVLGMDFDEDCDRPVFSRISAGLSGPAILPIALEAVWRVSRAVGIPVIGVGGISSMEDARKFFMAGASAIQIGTAIFYDPMLPERIVESIEANGVPAAPST